MKSEIYLLDKRIDEIIKKLQKKVLVPYNVRKTT